MSFWVSEFDILEGYIFHRNIHRSQENSWRFLWVIDGNISKHNILIMGVDRFTFSPWVFRPANRARMCCAQLIRITLLGRTNPNSKLFWLIHDDILIGNILNSSFSSSKFHVNTFQCMMHPSISESNILNSLVTD